VKPKVSKLPEPRHEIQGRILFSGGDEIRDETIEKWEKGADSKSSSLHTLSLHERRCTFIRRPSGSDP